jgi:uncharacterized SAM-binding protein YcdF (DUF218 family)
MRDRIEGKETYKRWLRRAGATSFLLWTAGAFALDRYGERPLSEGKWDAIVVAGCKVRQDGTASLALIRRTRSAADLWRQGLAPKVLLTGGTTDSRPTESSVAMAYGVEAEGIPKDVFLLESQSKSTEENAYFAAESHPDIRRILIVTDSYHIFRAERVFGRHFAEVAGAGSTPAWNVRIPGAYREVLAVAYYWLKGRI